MELTQIIEHLSTIVEHKPPAEAILAAKENWPAFLPVVTELMQKFEQEELSEQENNLLFMGILLLVEMQQYDHFEAFAALCDGEDSYKKPLGQLLGDSVTESLSSYFYILANGNHQSLAQLLTSSVCGEYIRNSALDAIFAQYESGQLAKETLTALVDHLLVLYKAQKDAYLLGSLADLLINYQWQSYQTTFIALFDEGYIESFFLPKECIENWHIFGKNEGVLASGLVKSEFDTLKAIKCWICYQPKVKKSAKKDKSSQLIFDLPTTLTSSTSTHIIDKNKHLTIKSVTPKTEIEKALGRNDPCHCGSGKKYKKCCL